MDIEAMRAEFKGRAIDYSEIEARGLPMARETVIQEVGGYRLCKVEEGVAVAGSAGRWESACYRVRYSRPVRGSRAFLTLEEARAAFSAMLEREGMAAPDLPAEGQLSWAMERRDLLNGFPVVRSADTPARGALRAGRVVMVDRGEGTAHGRYVVAWADHGADHWIAGEYLDSEMEAQAAFADRLARETGAAARRLALRGAPS